VPFVFGQLGVVAHLWSIGVEEQFYVSYPFLLKHVRSVVQVACLIIAMKVLAFALLNTSDQMFQFLQYIRFESMAIGAVFAWLLYRRDWTLRLFYNRAVQIAVLAAILFAVLIDAYSSVAYDVAMSIIFALLILNVSSNPNSLLKLERPTYNALGRISYGIYMFHTLMMFLLMAAFPSISDAVFYALTLALTLAVAQLSYRYFESPFLRLKDRTAVPVTATRPVASPSNLR
jgi:peptidoglycan/LPS O-acetylase OafA/YrhL